LAIRPSVRAALRAYYDAGQLPGRPAGALRELAASLDEIQGLYSNAGIYVLDRDAHVMARSSRSLPLSPALTEIGRKVAETASSRIDLVGKTPDETLISFGVAVIPEPGTLGASRTPAQPLGVALVVFDAAHTLFPLVTQEGVPTRTGETVLVRREGNDIVFFSPLRHVPAGSQYLRLPLSAAPGPARLALEGRETFVEFNDYRGVPVLAATRHIPLTGWGLVRKIDRREAMEDFGRMAVVEGVAAGLLVILLGGLLLFHRRDVMTRVVKKEEEKFRALLESAPDAIYIIEPSTLRILGRNRRAAEMDGYSDEDIAHMTATDLHPPEDHTLLQERFEGGSETGGVLPLQTLHHRRKDGQLVPVEESQKLVDAGGERLVLSIVRDITERQRAEQELRRANRALRTVSECNQVIVRAAEEPHLLEEVCGILVREGGYRMAWVGFGEHDAGKSVRPVAHAGFEEGYLQTASITWADTERGRGPTGTAFRSGKPVVVRDIRADPSLAPWREEALKRGYASSIALPILLPNQVLGALTIYAEEPDVFDSAEMQLLAELSNDLAYGIQTLRTRAERQRAEEALGKQASLLSEQARLLDLAPVAIMLRDLESRIIFWNPEAERIYGWTQDEALGKVTHELFQTQFPKPLSQIEAEVSGGAHWQGELLHTKRNGERIVVASRWALRRDKQGNPAGFLEINADITEGKRAEEEVKRLNERLEQRVAERTAELEAANKELEAFTYSVSHDLRAPLRHVDGFSKLLVEEHGAELSPDAQEYVATIRDSVLQMGRLIDDLLNLARVGRKQLAMQVTGLNSLAEEVMADLKRANPDRLIEWKIETLPFVECDPALIKQVFVNLLSNAVKFTRPRKPAVIELGVANQDGARAVFVRDNGVGFSMKYANKLFGVFQRLHRSEDFEGTGVGLATVQRIIHKHRGRVWAQAELDKGATFYFTVGSPDHPAAT
jgi:PAS domain S-box-containing protein